MNDRLGLPPEVLNQLERNALQTVRDAGICNCTPSFTVTGVLHVDPYTGPVYNVDVGHARLCRTTLVAWRYMN